MTVFVIHTDEGLTGLRPVSAIQRSSSSRSRRAGRPGSFLFERHTDMIRNNGGPWLAHPPVWGIEMALWDLFGKAAASRSGRSGAATPAVKAYASMIEMRSPERPPRTPATGVPRHQAPNSLLDPEGDIAQWRRPQGRRRPDGDHGRRQPGPDTGHPAQPGRPRLDVERALAPAASWSSSTCAGWRSRSPIRLRRLAELTRATNQVIAGGENNVGLHEFRTLIDQGCYDIVQADAVCSEGMFQLRKVAAYAEMHNSLSCRTTAGAPSGSRRTWRSMAAARTRRTSSCSRTCDRRGGGLPGADRAAVLRARRRGDGHLPGETAGRRAWGPVGTSRQLRVAQCYQLSAISYRAGKILLTADR